jgi:hypothetical protein
VPDAHPPRAAAPPRAFARAWPHLRALLISLHVLAVILGALPAPSGGMKRGAWRDPTVQDEFAAWRGRLAAVGLEVDAQTFEDELWAFATRFMAARAVVLKPFGPYYRHFGTLQTWRMFVAPHRYPARLHIDIYENGHWVNVYEEQNPGPDWKQGLLEQDRFRSALFRYSWASYERSYRQFAAWIAKAAAVDYPEASAVRLRWFKYKTLPPAQAAAGVEPTGSFIMTHVVPTHPDETGAVTPPATAAEPADAPTEAP